MKKTIITLLIIMFTISIAILIYCKLIEIETKNPKEIDEKCEITNSEFMGRKVFTISPKNIQKSRKEILYLHGGAYMAEATEKHWEFLQQIVKDTGIEIIMPDYPLAPKYDYKDVFQMVEPLYKEIIEKEDVENLIIMGDSAGGGLALALEEKLAKGNVLIPEKTILISPWLDVRLTNPEIDEIQKNDKELKKETLKLAGISYSGKDGLNSYLVNPINGDVSKLKNINILIGTYDILYPDVKKLKEKAKDIVELKVFEKAPHIWIIEKNTTEDLIQKGYQEILELLK